MQKHIQVGLSYILPILLLVFLLETPSDDSVSIVKASSVSKSSIRFLVVSDYHLGWENIKIGRIQHYTKNLYDFAEQENADFVVIGGDFNQPFGGSPEGYKNYTLEVLYRQRILTFNYPGDHEHSFNAHKNWTQLTSLPNQFAYKLGNVNFIFAGSHYEKAILPNEVKTFIELELRRNSGLTNILLTQNPLFNTTGSVSGFSSTDLGHYYLDQSWWRGLFNTYNIPLVIHANNHVPLHDSSVIALISRYNTTWVALDYMGRHGTSPEDRPPHAVYVEIYIDRVEISKVNLYNLTETPMGTIWKTTTLDSNVLSTFSIGGRIHHNQTKTEYNHFMSDSAALEIIGDPFQGELNEFSPFQWLAYDSGSDETHGPRPFSLRKTHASVKWSFTWNEASKELNFTFSKPIGIGQLVLQQKENIGGSFGLIEAAPSTSYTITLNIKSSKTTVDDLKFVVVLHNETSDVSILEGGYFNLTPFYEKISWDFTTPNDVTSIFPKLHFRKSGTYKIIDLFSVKVRGASTTTQNARLYLNDTPYGYPGTLEPWTYRSYSIPNNFSSVKIRGNIKGSNVALYRIIFNNFQGFVQNRALQKGIRGLEGDVNGDEEVDIGDVRRMVKAFGSRPGDENWNPFFDVDHNQDIDIRDIALVARHFGSKREQGDSYTFKEARNPYTPSTYLFFVSSREPKVNIAVGQLESFTSPIWHSSNKTLMVVLSGTGYGTIRCYWPNLTSDVKIEFNNGTVLDALSYWNSNTRIISVGFLLGDNVEIRIYDLSAIPEYSYSLFTIGGISVGVAFVIYLCFHRRKLSKKPFA